MIRIDYIKTGDSIIELSKKCPSDSLTFVSINEDIKPIDSPLKSTDFGIVIINRCARSAILVISIYGEHYIKMASGYEFTYGDWYKLN